MPMASSSKKTSRTRKSSNTSAASHTRSLSAQKTEITINVYDLLPPGRLSSLLWTIGGSLLHSGVVIANREYAYGGHSKRGVTGVYYTKARYEPPGGTFRVSILQGFTFKTAAEIHATIKQVSDEFLGPSYNLLTHNCNHFTNALCEALTGKQAPGWLNRAASIGLALPCVVPKEWISPPDVETADGELLEEDDEDGEDENEGAGMMAADRRRQQREEERRWREEEERRRGSKAIISSEDEEVVGESLAGGKRITPTEELPPPRLVSRTDNEGRPLPVAERAPVPKKATTSTSTT